MPEMHFSIEWPSGARERCYSPSSIIETYLVPGETYPVADFLERIKQALHIASARVESRYGFACSSALDQLATIRATADALSAAERAGLVRVLTFEKHPPRDARRKT